MNKISMTSQVFSKRNMEVKPAYAGKFPMPTFNTKNMVDIICNHKKCGVKKKYAIDFASTQLRIIRLRKYPIDPKAYLELCNNLRNINSFTCDLILPPANFVCGGYTVFTLSVRPCVRPSVCNILFP